jgi:hypothetical protein
LATQKSAEETTLDDLLKKISRKAQPKHLRMFEAWCSEYDSFTNLRVACTELEKGANNYKSYQMKRFLPVDELKVLQREFDRLDCSGNGFILPEDIVSGWAWTEEAAKETIATYDIHRLGRIEKNDFLKMMCPEEFRLPEMDDVGSELLGKLIVAQATEKRLILDAREAQYSNHPFSDAMFVPPTTALPEVSEVVWVEWNTVFDGLDSDGDERVFLEDLLQSGLHEAVCHSVERLIDPEIVGSFTRAGYLSSLLQAHRCRHTALK